MLYVNRKSLEFNANAISSVTVFHIEFNVELTVNANSSGSLNR